MSASDWLVLAQTVILAITVIPAVLALKASASTGHREALASRIRADEVRLDQVADQIARLSVATGDVKQGVPRAEVKMEAEQLRLRALIAPLGKFRMDALRKYASADPTHGDADDISAALDEVTQLSQSLRDHLGQVLEPSPHPWWKVWRW
jgi:uncharacterized protein YPO0396